MAIVRLRYAHSDPIFHRVRAKVIAAGTSDAVGYLVSGRADVGFVPITHASQHCDALTLIPRLAIYSVGEIISVRVFRGRGRGYAAVSETSVGYRAAKLLLGAELSRVEDPYSALDMYGGVLVIGDEALRMVDRGFEHMYDIGELWEARLRIPLVYAVLVARRGVPRDVVERYVEEMENSIASFYDHPELVIASASARIGVSRELLERYYMRVKYFINSAVTDAMRREAELLGLDPCLFTT